MPEKSSSILHMRTRIVDPMAAIRMHPTERDVRLLDIAFVMNTYPDETKGLTFEQLGVFLRKKREEVDRLGRETRREQKTLEILRMDAESLNALTAWGDSRPALQKPRELTFRKFRRAMIEGNLVQYGPKCDGREFDREVMKLVEPFVIEHDWSAALRASDGGDVRLPYDVCAFEFRYGDRPVIAIATQFESDIMFSLAVEMDRWTFCTCAMSIQTSRSTTIDGLSEMHSRVADQIRAVCIALDAEVAVSETVRASHSGSGPAGQHAMGNAHHVVSLSSRHARPASLPGEPTGRHVRMHFRRGHWRHFETHKTWIKWMLVGDPDLGFIEKHYTL